MHQIFPVNKFTISSVIFLEEQKMYFLMGTSEKLLTSIIKQNWRQESIGVHKEKDGITIFKSFVLIWGISCLQGLVL